MGQVTDHLGNEGWTLDPFRLSQLRVGEGVTWRRAIK